MIQVQTRLTVADNSGAKEVQCIKVLGGTRRRYAQIGDIIVAVVKKAEPRKETKMHEVVKVVIVRQKKAYRRKDGTYVSFSDNAAVVLAKGQEPRGQRIFGPIPRELKEKGFTRIHSLAQEVV